MLTPRENALRMIYDEKPEYIPMTGEAFRVVGYPLIEALEEPIAKDGYDPFLYVEKEVQNGGADAGFTIGPVDTQIFETFPLFSLQTSLLVYDTHPLARKEEVDLRELEGVPMVIESDAFKIHHLFIGACREAGFEPNILFCTSGFSLCHKLCAQKRGCSLVVNEISSDMRAAGLKKVKLRQVLNSGYLQYFLEPKGFHLFPNVGQTERPDTLCAKLDEGRIGVLVDGNPFVLIVPYLFSENFQTMDDYCSKPYYATLMRLIKYLAFGLAVLLPGLYVAIGTFHQELVPHALLFSIVAAEETTPFSLMVEALVIHFLYEIMREAGLRLPKAIGHAVSIVGALVIGDVAVSAGLIGTPMVLVVALTAISSFVVPNLHQPVSLLRFLLIVIGGTSGLYGISLAIAAVAVNAASMQNGGVPYLSPISPLNATSLGDTFVRKNTKWLSRHHITINHLYGSNPPKSDSHKE